MPVQGPGQVEDFVLRGNYPNLYSRFLDVRSQSPAEDLPGYRAAQVEYWLKGSSDSIQIPVRGVDIPILNSHDNEEGCRYLSLLIRARAKDIDALAEVDRIIKDKQEENEKFCESLSLIENENVVPSYTANSYRAEEISHKGKNLVKLSQQGYSVPDFCILTTSSYRSGLDVRPLHLGQALQNLEQMSERTLDSPTQPLIFALRYAMPSYIPGLMPTYLNVGTTEVNLPVLGNIYGEKAARKMYFNNLKNLRSLLATKENPISEATCQILDEPGNLKDAIDLVSEEIRAIEPRLLTQASFQAEFLDRCSRQFFEENQDLIFTLSQGRSVQPALIIQQMICTVRGNESYPGVLYSRNPNTGRHCLVETVRSIFGEDIMTGNVQAQVDEFEVREEIKEEFPALYHFVPSLPVLEKEFGYTVTAEFASESVRHGHFFALLQLNESELTGRAALVSTMDLYHEGLLPKQNVPGLVKPFHFRQIMSDTIDEEAFDSLEYFSEGYSILPRSAISARVFFDAEKAVIAGNSGEENICLCKTKFEPSDAVAIGKVDVILSLTPAAIHLVTSCRGQGTLAFLDLENYGVRLVDGKCMINPQGLEINEGDWITVSSRRKKVYKGQAQFTPARFNKYRQGAKLDLSPREKEVFDLLETAFSQYHDLTRNLKADQVETYRDLVKLVQTDLKDVPEKANEIVNMWVDFYPEEYVSAILGGDLGSHNKQAEVYGYLSLDRRVCFFQLAVARCQKMGLKGLTAGSFMLGRFIQETHSISFWNRLSDRQIGFLLNEWIYYRKYREVLRDVGEHRIARARKILVEGPEQELKLGPVDGKTFVELKLSRKNLANIASSLGKGSNPEVLILCDMLQKPYSYFYEYKFPWSLNPLKKICAKEGLPLPGEDDV